MDSQPVTAVGTYSSPKWLPSLLEWLQSLRQVQKNWDGYDADAPRPEMIEAASEFIRSIVERVPVGVPYATPTRVGGIVFAWEQGPHQMEVEFDPEEANSFLYLNTETDEGVEGPLPMSDGPDGEFMLRLKLFEG